MEAIEQLYRKYRDDVYRYLCSLTHDAQAAEDLLSETFLKALQALGRYDGRASVRTWLFAIARHAWVDSLRRHKPTVSYEDLLAGYLAEGRPAAADVPADQDRRELADRAKALLASRKAPAPEILRLRALGYSFAEIAVNCGISESSARTLDFRTRKWLREQLEKEGYTNE